MQNPDQYKATKRIKGLWLFFVSRRRYLIAAIEHAAWLELQAEDLRTKFLEGKYTPTSETTRARELQRFKELRHQLWFSFRQTAVLALVALMIARLLDAVDPGFPLHPIRALGFCGTFLIAWAALFELGGPRLASWAGETLSEIVHPAIFQFLFIPGTFGLLCAILL